MPRTDRAVALVRDFVEDRSSGPRRSHVGSLGRLDPVEVLDLCQGAAMAWAVSTLPGTRLFLVAGSLVAAR